MDPFGKRYSREEQKVFIKTLNEYIPFKGKVKMKSPQYEFYVHEDFGKNADPHFILKQVWFTRKV